MATLQVAWIRAAGTFDGNAPTTIAELLGSEDLTTSTSNAQTAAAPAKTTHAICTAQDAYHKVTVGAANPNATSDPVVAVPIGGFHLLPAAPGQKIAAITA